MTGQRIGATGGCRRRACRVLPATAEDHRELFVEPHITLDERAEARERRVRHLCRLRRLHDRRSEADDRRPARVGIHRTIAKHIDTVREDGVRRDLRRFGAAADGAEVGEVVRLDVRAGAGRRPRSERRENVLREVAPVPRRVYRNLDLVGDRRVQRAARETGSELLEILMRIENLDLRLTAAK